MRLWSAISLALFPGFNAIRPGNEATIQLLQRALAPTHPCNSYLSPREAGIVGYIANAVPDYSL